MRFLIVGLGSMGKRRIRNLKQLKAGEIVGFDSREDRRKEAEKTYGIQTVPSVEHGMKWNPDVVIISTPPDKHYAYALEALRRDKHFFMEVNVVLKGLQEVINESKKHPRLLAAPSATFRFKTAIRKIKEIIDKGKIGKVLCLHYHLGQYLPDWHPWEDYKKFYVSKRKTGGCREMVAYELEWLTWIFGKVNKISCMKDKLSDLDIDIDDVYSILLKFENGAQATILIDVLSKQFFRTLRVIGSEGNIEWSWSDNCVKMYLPKNKTWKTYKEEKKVVKKGHVTEENMYVNEMRHLIKAVKGEEKYIYSLEDDKRVLKLLELAEKSSDTNKHLMVRE